MPEMDGTETMQNIRKMSSRHKDMKIVVVTANAVAGVRNELIGAGFTDYAAKPVTVSTLKLMLTKYLPQGRKTISSEEKMATRGQGHKGIEETFSSDILKLPEYIDRAEGLKNAGGDISVYRSVIEVICSCASEVITKIKDFFEEKDLKNYSILAHSMKSNAATVGYSMLAEFAKQQEVAARNGSVEEVEAGGQHFISEYEKFINDMEECLRETDRRASRNEKTGGDTDTEQNQSINISKTNKQAEEYKLTLREAVRCINCERYEDAMDLFDILHECSIPPVVKNILTEVKKDIQAKNWGKVTEMLESYM